MTIFECLAVHCSAPLSCGYRHKPRFDNDVHAQCPQAQRQTLGCLPVPTYAASDLHNPLAVWLEGESGSHNSLRIQVSLGLVC